MQEETDSGLSALTFKTIRAATGIASAAQRTAGYVATTVAAEGTKLAAAASSVTTEGSKFVGSLNINILGFTQTSGRNHRAPGTVREHASAVVVQSHWRRVRAISYVMLLRRQKHSSSGWMMSALHAMFGGPPRPLSGGRVATDLSNSTGGSLLCFTNRPGRTMFAPQSPTAKAAVGMPSATTLAWLATHFKPFLCAGLRKDQIASSSAPFSGDAKRSGRQRYVRIPQHAITPAMRVASPEQQMLENASARRYEVRRRELDGNAMNQWEQWDRQPMPGESARWNL